jgi:beta-aspartyl-peptidase (threonine type)
MMNARWLSALVVTLACVIPITGRAQTTSVTATGTHKWALVVHGGAGVIARASMTPEAEAKYRAGIKEALDAAAAVLDKGGSSLDAVESAIKLLEDNPLFNAGKGRCLLPMAPTSWTRR